MVVDPASWRDVPHVRELQERAARAIPAAVEDGRAGCWLRWTDSPVTWWAGAALLHGGAEGTGLDETLDRAEDFYAAHGGPARFQVCPGCPPGLDGALAGRAYARSGDVSLLVVPTSRVAAHAAGGGLRVDVTEVLALEWFRLLVAAQGPEADDGAEWRLLERVDRPSAYVTVTVSGRPVAVGRAVADTGWTGVFSMATVAEARGRGAGSAVLGALAEWAGGQASAGMYLQVTDDSGAARRLYRRAGFRPAATYHYRSRP